MVRRTLDDIKASRSDLDQAILDATTDEDIRRQMIEDGEDPDADVPDHARLVVAPQLVRKKLGMTQEEFAGAIKVPVETLRDWEANHLDLDPAIQSLLAIIYRMPEALNALKIRQAA